MAYVYSTHISNPTAVWHELKNARAVLGPEGEQWHHHGWYASAERFGSFTMCLSNVLRFVGLGNRADPRSHARHKAAKTEAERLVLYIINQRYGRHEDIPSFNDTRVLYGFDASSKAVTKAKVKAFQQIARVLDEAIAAVQPYAFQHTVTIAEEVMTEAESKEIEKAVAEDAVKQQHKFLARLRRAPKKRLQTRIKRNLEELLQESDDPDVIAFKEWLDSFEQRGWDTFWEELADCDSQDCEKVRALVGI